MKTEKIVLKCILLLRKQVHVTVSEFSAMEDFGSNGIWVIDVIATDK
jgi:hypothetical protein